MRKLLHHFGAVLFLTATMMAGKGQAQTLAPPVPPPLSAASARFFAEHPDRYAAFLANLPRRLESNAVETNDRSVRKAGGIWTAVTVGPSGLCNPLLMSDGTVMVHNCDTPSWYKLTPDNMGNYAAGTWTQLASLPKINGTQYAPQYNASAVLPDGRVIVMGGEYNGSGSGVWTNLGAIYTPSTNKWAAVAAPSGSGWSQIGDAQSIILPNGTFMLGSCCASPDANALLDAETMKWTATGAPAGGKYQDEQGYNLLSTGKVLTVDIWTNGYPTPAFNTEVYTPKSGKWSPSGDTPVSLPDPCGTAELGPAVTRGDGTVVAFGGNSGCNGVTKDPTAVYTTATGTWVAGPYVPSTCGTNIGCDLADAPAALMFNGKILFAAGPGFGNSPTHFFEFGADNTITQVSDPLFNNKSSGSYYYNFLNLPNGQILMTDFSKNAEVYTPDGAAVAANMPIVTSVRTTVKAGKTYTVAGQQLNGVTQGSYYGDDAQAATNYPLVSITNVATGHMVYAPTSKFSTMSIKPGVKTKASFTVPAATEKGASNMVVVASGVASKPVAITVQ